MDQQTNLWLALCLVIVYACIRLNSSGFVCILLTTALVAYFFNEDCIDYVPFKPEQETSAKVTSEQEEPPPPLKKNIYGQSYDERKRLYERMLMDLEAYRGNSKL
tara:strand:- start:220 stop:534 length:315 start_codon:yes stop_codon:yes gene_type:complete